MSAKLNSKKRNVKQLDKDLKTLYRGLVQSEVDTKNFYRSSAITHIELGTIKINKDRDFNGIYEILMGLQNLAIGGWYQDFDSVFTGLSKNIDEIDDIETRISFQKEVDRLRDWRNNHEILFSVDFSKPAEDHICEDCARKHGPDLGLLKDIPFNELN